MRPWLSPIALLPIFAIASCSSNADIAGAMRNDATIDGLSTGVLIPVVFVPSDESVTPAEIFSVSDTLLDVQQWYLRQLTAHRLRVAALVTVAGDRTAAEYLQGETMWDDG